MKRNLTAAAAALALAATIIAGGASPANAADTIVSSQSASNCSFIVKGDTRTGRSPKIRLVKGWTTVRPGRTSTPTIVNADTFTIPKQCVGTAYGKTYRPGTYRAKNVNRGVFDIRVKIDRVAGKFK